MPIKHQEKFTHWMVRGAILLVLLTCQIIALQAQTYDSHSTGALGAFAPTKDTEIQLPDNGELHYTTINIPADVTVTFKRNSKNTPVIMLAKNDVTIAGTINISGKPGTINNSGTLKPSGGAGGPGGFDGGSGGFFTDPYFNGNSGDGPGGGGGGRGSFNHSVIGDGGGGGYVLAAQVGSARGNVANSGGGGFGGSSYGSRLLLPLMGGSGGGGGGGENGGRGNSGGGGGGAIMLASSGTISFTGSATINADGGYGYRGEGGTSYGGGGAGGAIRLVATTITGSVRLWVRGAGSPSAGQGSYGYIRLEAYNFTNFVPDTQPRESNLLSSGFPPTTSPVIPQLVIASIAGQNAPATPLGSFAAAPDITVPAAQTNPVNVVLQGANIPVGTTVKVTVTPETGGTRTTAPDVTLTGTVAASTATAQATLPTGMSVISATATIDLTIAKAEPRFINGERVTRMEIAASYGGASEITYITESGKRIRQTE